MFKDRDTSYLIEFLNTYFKYGSKRSFNHVALSAYQELKRRQPKIAKLYEYKMAFKDDKDEQR